MKDDFMNDLSMSFAMDLYRTKIKAEKRDDKKALESLQKHYPELFSDEFSDFIEQTKRVVQYLDEKHNENFSRIFEPDYQGEPEDVLH